MSDQRERKPRLLLHVCCIGCGAYVFKVLENGFDVELFFYNPNIYPPAEYDLRLEETKRIADKLDLTLTAGEYGHNRWLEQVKGLESEPERGARCHVCYRMRLAATALRAKENGFAYFTTTLSISPHKDAERLNRFGQELARQYGLKYFTSDFKKQDGFKKASALSKELNLYRQDYCGCEFSIRKI